nr:MAG TPA: hypothetical protein [Caudoviricetes sp.]
MNELFLVNLGIHDGEGGGGTAGAAAAGSAESAGTPAGTEAAGQEAQQGADDRAEFERLIKDKYKAYYDEKVQGHIKERFKASKQAEARMQKTIDGMQPVMQMLAEKYHADPGDVEAISKAIQEDSSYYEDEAAERGMSVEQLKEFKRISRENAALRAAEEQRQEKAGQQEAMLRWQQQSETVAQKYPGFQGLEEEANDPVTGERFLQLLSSGIDVENAYKVVHMDDLISGALEYGVNKARHDTVQTIKARGMRPSENGASGTGAAVQHKDVASLTKDERAQLMKRALRGESIDLK